MQRFAPQELVAELEAAFGWLHSLGIRYEATRFANYAATIKKYAEAFEAAIRNGSGEIPISRAISAMFECNDLIQIHTHFPRQPHKNLVESLYKFVSGPRSYVEENPSTSSNAARNFGLELIIAARLMAAGIPLIFDTRADVAGDFDGQLLLFQCKRVMSMKKLKDNFEKGVSQLHEDYAVHSGRECYGIVVIEMTPADESGLRRADLRPRRRCRPVVARRVLPFHG
jgi:hypothetical protein